MVAVDANDRVILRGQTTVNTGERPIPPESRPFGLYLTANVYGPTEGEVVWDTPNRAGRYEVYRNGSLYRSLVGADFSSLYESGLNRGVDYEYEVVSFDRCGVEIIRDTVVLNTNNPQVNPSDFSTEIKLSDRVYSESTAEIFWNQVNGAAVYQVEENGVVVQASGARSIFVCLLYTSPSPRDATLSRMPSSA